MMTFINFYWIWLGRRNRLTGGDLFIIEEKCMKADSLTSTFPIILFNLISFSLLFNDRLFSDKNGWSCFNRIRTNALFSFIVKEEKSLFFLF